MKKFFGGIFIEKNKLEEAGIKYPVKLEYYKITNEDGKKINNNLKFGISIVKTEYMKSGIKIEKKDIEMLYNEEEKVNKILELFKNNQVTPIGADDVLEDLNKI